MKRTRLLLPAALLAALTVVGLSGCTGTAAAATATVTTGQVTISNQQDGFWVTGEGKVTVKPDIANISLGVSSREASVADSMAKTKDAMNKVLTALKADKIDSKDIQTQQYNISPTYSYKPMGGGQSISGYQVTNLINVKLRDITKVNAVIADVTTAGGDLTQINNVNFTVEDPTQYYKDTRQKAIADADHKAQKLAGLYGVTLGKPTYVLESSSNQQFYNSVNQGWPVPATTLTMAMSSSYISPGSTDVTLYIQASYPVLK